MATTIPTRTRGPEPVVRPPGPRPRDTLEPLLDLRRDPIGRLLGLARDHGDIVYMRLGSFDVYLVNHPDHVRDVLVTNNRKFMKGQGLQEAKRVLGEGLLTSEGEFHHRQRRLIQPIFHHQLIDEYGQAMVEFGARYRERWHDGQTFDLHRELMGLTLAIVGKTLFGADVERDAS